MPITTSVFAGTFSFVGVDSLDPAITKHVAAELIQTAQDTARPQEASEATYGLAVLIMNGHVADERSHKGREGGLLWLEEAAHLGNDRAKAMFFRACKAFGSDIPAKSINQIQSWLLDAGSKGYFTALEDLREMGLKDSISEATDLLGAIYGGTGAKRFDDDLFPLGFPRAGFSFDEDLSKRASTVTQVRNFRMNHFADCILHFAASCGLNMTAEKLVANDPAGVDTRNINGETPLLLRCRSGHYHISMVFLEAGADPKLASHYGDTPLHWLSSFEDKHVMDVARKLIERGAELDAAAEAFRYTDCKENEFVAGSPLMRAVGRKRLKVIEALLKLGADPDVSVEGISAIFLAAQLHQPHILELLLSESRHEPRTVDQSSGLSLLIPAIRGGCIEPTGSFFGRVQRHGSRWRYAARETLDVLICHGAGEYLHDVPGLPGLTALGLAVGYAEPDLVEHLLEIGCAEDINRPSTVVADPEVERSPLTESICSGKLDTFRLLVKKGANVKALKSLHGTVPVTLLYECAWNGIDNANVAQNLLDLGVPVDERPADYETPFGCALRNRCFELARCLLRNGADINAEYNAGLFFTRDHAMSTLGHLIAECSISSVVCLNFILRRPKLLPRFVVSQDSCLSVLHALASTPHRKQDDRASALILDCLLTNFDPDQSQLDLTTTDQKYTALHLAALQSNYPVARGLLFAKADPSLKDASGFTALDTARYCLSNFPHSFEFLVSAVPRIKTLAAAKKRVERMVTLFEGKEIRKGAQAVPGE